MTSRPSEEPLGASAAELEETILVWNGAVEHTEPNGSARRPAKDGEPGEGPASAD